MAGVVGNPELIIRGITGFAAGMASAGIPRGGGETLPPLSKTRLAGRSTAPRRATFNFVHVGVFFFGFVLPSPSC